MMGAVSGLCEPQGAPVPEDAEKRREEEMESLLKASAAPVAPPVLPSAPCSGAEKARVLLREAAVIEAPLLAYYLQVYALELLIKAKQSGQCDQEAERMLFSTLQACEVKKGQLNFTDGPSKMQHWAPQMPWERCWEA